MRPGRDRPACAPAARALSVALLAASLAIAAAAQSEDGVRSDVTGPVELILAQAEQALEDQEPQLAESLYRDALLEGWLLAGSLAIVDGDLAAARDALGTATRAAVAGSREAGAALALVEQWAGESANPDDVRARLEAIAPRLAVGALAAMSEAERHELRALLEATLGRVYRNLGVLCEQSRRPRQAAAHFARADALDPPGGAEKAVLGSVDLRRSPPAADLAARGQDDETEEQLVAAIAAASAAAPVADKAAAQRLSHLHQRLARLYLTRGDEKKAVAELRTAAGLGELDRDLGLKLADLEVAGHNPAAARRVLQALTSTYASPRALLKLAELTWSLGPPKSLPILLEARDLAPNSEEILGNTANAYLAADEPEKALEVLAPLMAMHPDIVVYFRLLGEAHTKLGRLDEAAAALREAIALEPTYLRTRVHLAGVLLSQKRFDAAEAELREILAVDPERPDAKELLEFLEEERGRSPNGG